ncbi:MAG: glycoside hydrolase 100 family protein, partial [Lamprobacter sp.]|uniref:glycoside hydrolase 100 family protein n=1 Tax=Lamprobacter sp. TaxID=3100796 RepID=UPI002B260310
TDHGDGEALVADFGEHAIARVAPVDSGFWWLLTLQAYVHVTEDRAFLHQASVQKAIRLVLDLSMTSRFDMFGGAARETDRAERRGDLEGGVKEITVMAAISVA